MGGNQLLALHGRIQVMVIPVIRRIIIHALASIPGRINFNRPGIEAIHALARCLMEQSMS